jgi:hypothetical protein
MGRAVGGHWALSCVAVLGCGVLPGCRPNGGDGCGGGAIGLPAEPCELACASWTNQVRPEAIGTERFALAPDWSASPPQARISVGQRFRVTVGRLNLQPANCTTSREGPVTFRSSDETVLRSPLAEVYEGVGPGVARVIVDVREPSGRMQAVELTVCGDPTANQITCPVRVPLPVAVVP